VTPEPYHVVCESEDFQTTVNVACLELAIEFCDFLTLLGWTSRIELGHYPGPLTPLAEDTTRALVKAFANRPGA